MNKYLVRVYQTDIHFESKDVEVMAANEKDAIEEAEEMAFEDGEAWVLIETKGQEAIPTEIIETEERHC